MKPYYQDSHVTVYNGDCLHMDDVPDGSVQCVVTSPPYWGLRKYAGLPDSIWGGVGTCEHQWQSREVIKQSTPVALAGRCGNGNGEGRVEKPTSNIDVRYHDSTCLLCGAWRGQYGLEPTVGMYVEHSIAILREIRRVLRDDGVVFWNVGDSYAGSNKGMSGDKHYGGVKQNTNKGSIGLPVQDWAGLKPKDLCLVPQRVAIAAQDDGWWVRSIIIWNKQNPMPEAVTDRPTESHEYILMLTKSARYYWDQEAVREKANYDGRKDTMLKPSDPARNLRSVWTFATQPYPEAHFATFPEDLPERCIKAATPEVGSCAKCGAPWDRIVSHKNMVIKKTDGCAEASGNRTATAGTMVSPAETITLGWQPTCKCGIEDKAPAIVLDPFSGSGTTVWVAKKLARHAIGYELSKEYCDLIIDRNRQQEMF